MSRPGGTGPGNSAADPGPEEHQGGELPQSGQVSMHGSAHDGARVYQAINMYIYESDGRPAQNATDVLAERVVSLARMTRIGPSFRVTPYLHRPVIERYVSQHRMDEEEKFLASFGSNPKTEEAVPNPGSRWQDPLRGPAYVLVTTSGVRWVMGDTCGILRYTESWDATEFHKRMPSFEGKGLHWPKVHGLRLAFGEQAVWLASSVYWWQKCRDVSVLAQFLTAVQELART